MNAGLRLPGEGLGLNWEWVGFVVAIRRDTSMSSSSLYTGKNSEISLALLSFSYAPTHVSLYQLRGRRACFFCGELRLFTLGQKGHVPGNNSSSTLPQCEGRTSIKVAPETLMEFCLLDGVWVL